MKKQISNHIRLSGFGEAAGGAVAVEFAIICIPFVFLFLAIIQVAIYYMAQTSLAAGVIAEANVLRSNFTTATTAQSCPAAGVLKTAIVTQSGGLIQNNSSLSVDVRQFTTLASTAPYLAIVDGTCDYGSTTSVLVLRAQSSVPAFVPGFSSLAVRSSAIIRRQGY